MKAVIQRVSEARVTVNGQLIGEIGKGMVVLLAVGSFDGHSQVRWMADKLSNLRIFSDEHDRMNLSLLEIGADMLVVSQFTLYGDCRKGRRPSYSDAAPPDVAIMMYKMFCQLVREKGINVAEGSFGAHMQLELVNDGPVTLIVETPG